MTNERGNLPSASGAQILYSCHGSQRMIAGLKSESTPESLEGDAIHAALESEDFTGLDENSQTIAQRIQAMIDKALFEFGEPNTRIYKEQRMWIYDDDGNPAMSAKPDFVALAFFSGRALCVDAKSGYLPVTRAAQNIQLRVQALAISCEHPEITDVIAATAQFRLQGNYSAVHYTAKDLAFARQELAFHLRLAADPDAPLNAGEWCRFCPAAQAAVCPAAAAWSMLPVALVQQAGPPLTKATAGELARRLPLEAKVSIYKSGPIWEAIRDAVKEDLKATPLAELNKVGLTIGKPARVVSVDNAPLAQQLLVDSGLMTTDQFATCVKLVMSRVEEIVLEPMAVKMGISKTDAKAELLKVFAPASVEHFRTAPLRALKDKPDA